MLWIFCTLFEPLVTTSLYRSYVRYGLNIFETKRPGGQGMWLMIGFCFKYYMLSCFVNILRTNFYLNNAFDVGVLSTFGRINSILLLSLVRFSSFGHVVFIFLISCIITTDGIDYIFWKINWYFRIIVWIVSNERWDAIRILGSTNFISCSHENLFRVLWYNYIDFLSIEILNTFFG